MIELTKVDKAPLLKKYFLRYLKRLIEARENNEFAGRFYLYAMDPDTFESRLARIEHLGQTQAIVSEVGDIDEPSELDRRLLDVWAEIRVLDQLYREGFTSIQKVRVVADYTALKCSRSFAFQVTRISGSLADQVKAQKDKTKRETSPYGDLDDIHSRLSDPAWYFFWDALRTKNQKYRNWSAENTTKCIVIVTGDEYIQDSLVRQIACRQIRASAFDRGLGKRHFDELIWLPDVDPGAWFTFGNSPIESHCYADWKDVVGSIGWENPDEVIRREVDLESWIPRYKSDDPFRRDY
ncbi:MAG: hypothetical protein PHQ40_03625 [Anaerolineaceae bacterium]|nr:hypothetical protein [Anaerolineaceae bacterium]